MITFVKKYPDASSNSNKLGQIQSNMIQHIQIQSIFLKFDPKCENYIEFYQFSQDPNLIKIEKIQSKSLKFKQNCIKLHLI